MTFLVDLELRKVSNKTPPDSRCPQVISLQLDQNKLSRAGLPNPGPVERRRATQTSEAGSPRNHGRKKLSTEADPYCRKGWGRCFKAICLSRVGVVEMDMSTREWSNLES